jgi:hypothetical protein
VTLAGAIPARHDLEAMVWRADLSPRIAMKTNDPVLVLITIAVLVLEAAITLARAVLVPMVALLLTLVVSPRTTGTIVPALPEIPTPPPAAPEAPLARPHHHPITLLATELQALPVTTLRQLAGTRSKSIRKADLIAMVTACN